MHKISNRITTTLAISYLSFGENSPIFWWMVGLSTLLDLSATTRLGNRPALPQPFLTHISHQRKYPHKITGGMWKTIEAFLIMVASGLTSFLAFPASSQAAPAFGPKRGISVVPRGDCVQHPWPFHCLRSVPNIYGSSNEQRAAEERGKGRGDFDMPTTIVEVVWCAQTISSVCY